MTTSFTQLHVCLGSNFLYYLDTTSCDWDLEASTTGTDTYLWIVCPGLQPIKHQCVGEDAPSYFHSRMQGVEKTIKILDSFAKQFWPRAGNIPFSL